MHGPAYAVRDEGIHVLARLQLYDVLLAPEHRNTMIWIRRSLAETENRISAPDRRHSRDRPIFSSGVRQARRSVEKRRKVRRKG
jgi:hypothetical protein